MGTPLVRVLRRALFSGALVASLLGAFVAPATASAAVATFSSRTPASASYLTASPKTISVTIHDKYGIRGAGSYVMKVDGKTVKVKATYAVKGRKPDYTLLRLTYTVPRALSAKSHKVSVTIRDRKHHKATSTWSFTVRAPYTASFSSPAPAGGSSSADARPTIALNVTDKYGVQSAGASMTIDGIPVRPSLSYITAGVLTSCKVTYPVPGDLTDGSHTVVVTVRDAVGFVSVYSWSFTVSAPETILVDMPVTGSGCTDCHVDYPKQHPMTECAGCHGAGAPPRPIGSQHAGDPMNDYIPTWTAHTTQCATGYCHRAAASFPHKLDGDCSRCHNARYPSIPQTHTIDPASIGAVHVSTSRFCTRTGCHAASLTIEHYGHTDAGGARLTCATCHTSADPDVVAAIRSGSTACDSCHDLAAAPHPGTSTLHAATGGCVKAGCHSADVASLHKGDCSACHNTPISDTTCTRCHSFADHTALHDVAPDAQCSPCHGATNLTATHRTCEGCHDSTDPAVVKAIATRVRACSACHAGLDHVALHAVTAPVECGACHDEGNLTRIHSSCAICHSSKDPAVVSAIALKDMRCASCHGNGLPLSHRTHIATVTTATIEIGSTSYGVHACSECHASNDLLVLHVASPSCPTCHPTPADTAHPWNGGCTQTGCHAAGSQQPMHGSIVAAHAVTRDAALGCTADGCHSGGLDIAAIHAATPAGCATCHDTKRAPTAECATAGCHGASDAHPAANPHPTMAAKHSQGLPETCVKAGCHAADLSGLHAALTDGKGCTRCHVAGKPTVSGCTAAGCHSSTIDSSALHPAYVSAHAADAAACALAGCHQTDVIAIHTLGTKSPGCAACHATGKPLTKDCAVCHAGAVDSTSVHPRYGTGHTANEAGCTAKGCHPTNAITIHTAGSRHPGCPACHAPGKPALTLECSTQGCHETVSPSHSSHQIQPADAVITIGDVSYGSHRCVECHADLDLITVHGRECVTCHPGPADAAVLTSGCDQTGCHASGALKMHGSVDPKHAFVTTPSCIGADCHTGANAAALHVAFGCGTCHAPGRTASLDCSAAGCHGPSDAHPVADPHPGRDAAHTTGLATTCIGANCHTSDLVSLHADAFGCATCHAKDKAPSKDCSATGCHITAIDSQVLHKRYPSVHVAPVSTCSGAGCHSTNVLTLHMSGTNPPGCPACHAPGKPRLTLECGTIGCHERITSGPSHPAFSAAHTLAAPSACAGPDCHGAGTDVTVIHSKLGCATCHADGRPALTLTCETPGCHGPADPNPAAAPHPGQAAAHTTALPIACVRPGCHVTDLVTLHAKAKGCATCHAPGVHPSATCTKGGCHPAILSAASHPAYATAHALSAASQCAGPDCHSAAADVTVIHSKPGCTVCHLTATSALTLTCDTPGCHGPGDGHPLASPHPDMAASHTTGLCAACVASGCHTPDLVTLHAKAKGCATCHGADTTPSGDCAAPGCHPANGSPKHEAHTATVTSASFRINNLNYGTYECSLCHDSTDLIVIHGGRTSCAKCHPGPADGATPWNGGCDQNGCHSATSAHPMHADLQTVHLTAVQPKCTIDGCHFGNSSVGGRDAILVHFAKLKCATCHGAGKTPTLDCIKCHPQAATGDHQVDHKSCNDCHQPYVWDPKTSTANTGANLGPGPVSGVHWPLFDAQWTLLIGRAKILPGYPKGDYTELVFPGVIGTPGPYTSLPYFDRTGTYDCKTCHTGAGVTWVHPSSDRFLCGSGGDCHQHHGNWDPAENSESYVHYTPPASWTQIMKW